MGVLVYVVIAWKKKKRPVASEAAAVFLCFPGFSGGIEVFIRSLEDLKDFKSGAERAYFALAGILTIWVAMGSLVGVFSKLRESRPTIDPGNNSDVIAEPPGSRLSQTPPDRPAGRRASRSRRRIYRR